MRRRCGYQPRLFRLRTNAAGSRISICLLAAAAAFGQTWSAPKTAWGDPDLQGIWTSDDLHEVPFERPEKFGTRRFLTEDELIERTKDVDEIRTEVQENVRSTKGFWSRQKGVDAAAVPPMWLEYARKASNQTSLVVDPPSGRIPPLTPEGKARAAAAAALQNNRPDSYEERTLYDRCITRGITGSIFPVIYGNGTQFVQAPGLVAIRYEMIHETRIIPMDGRPHASANLRTYMGDPRGHWEGNTLVVDTTNFIGGRLAVNGGVPYSEDLHLVERFTRIYRNNIQYEVTITDPRTYTAPWTVTFPIRHEDGYRIFEYACHEGNYGLHNLLSAARAEDRADEAKVKGEK